MGVKNNIGLAQLVHGFHLCKQHVAAQLKEESCLQVAANHSDPDSPLVHSFISDDSYHLWRECCEAAIECCHKMIQNQKPASTTAIVNEAGTEISGGNPINTN